MEILVLCPFGIDSGLVSKAVSMGETRVLIPSKDFEKAREYGAKFIHLLNDIKISDEADFATFLSKKILQWGNTVVLAPATIKMRSILPYLAMKLNAGLTADCTSLSLADHSLLQTRPAFGNSLMATIRTLSKIQMATVRPGTFRALANPRDDATVFSETYVPKNERVKNVEIIPFDLEKPLLQSQIIVAGGKGIGSKEGFDILSQFAEKIGAGLAATRTAVDSGFAPYHCQVGMTGVTVCPRLYIAVGISGAVQHLAGMSGSKKIIAINNDPKAPIFNYADYGIVGDWEKVIQTLLEE